MASSAALSGLIRPIGHRGVHLRLFPRIETIAESREILRLIQQYGRVEMFRNLKYDTLPAANTMIAIFESEDSVRQLLKASPLRFYMRPEDLGERTLGDTDDQSAAPTPHARHYQLQINNSTFHHRDHVEQNAYNGSFRVSGRCAIQEDLAKNVPMSGLSEFTLRKEEKPWRVLHFEKQREEEQAKTLRKMLEEGRLARSASQPDVGSG